MAFLFTDIEGSSLKWLRHTEAMHAALADHDAILRDAIEAGNGEVFKTAGDAFYAAFAGVSDAVGAAHTAQKAISAHDWRVVEGLKVRMAVHVGAAKKREGDYFGPALNHCARLLALGHGGQVLASGVVGDSFEELEPGPFNWRAIGASPLDDPMQDVLIYQLVADGIDQDFPPLRDPTVTPNNLPRRLPPLIGRDAECDAIEFALASGSLVTLTGPGGVGKTRVALEVATRLANAGVGTSTSDELRQRLRAGVWFVELASLTDGSLLVSAVASVLGIEIGESETPAAILAGRLKNQQLLLVLDNCEHLIDAAAALSNSLLSDCRWLQILTTSQESLAVGGEVVIQLQPLGLPTSESPTAVEALGSSAVSLFVARSKGADSNFELDDKNAPIVSSICRRLDGVALAIEMAAAQAAVLGVQTLAQRLNERFNILTGGKRTTLARQQTLLATLDWSHDQLSDRERLVLRRLSIFSGGFTIAAASNVAADSTIDQSEVAKAISVLAKRSLVASGPDGQRPRYRLLETTREFGRGKLAEANETAKTAKAHANYLRVLMEACISDALVLSDSALRETYGPELDNLRAALDWALASTGDTAIGLSLLSAAEPLFSVLALTPEARRRMESALRYLTAAMPQQISARLWLSLGLAYGFSNPAKAYSALSIAAPFYRALGDQRLLAQILIFMGRFAQVVASHQANSPPLLLEAETLIQRAPCKRLEGHFFRGKGNEAANRGDFAESVKMMRRAHQAFTEAGADGAVSNVLTSLGYMLWASGEIDGAIDLCLEVLEGIRGRRFPDGPVLGFTLGNLAGMHTEQGNLQQARNIFAEAVPLLLDPWQLWVIFDHVALLRAREGQHELAARAAGFTNASYQAHGATRQVNEQRAHDTLLTILRHEIGCERLGQLIEEGSFFTEEVAATIAMADSAT